MLSVEAGSDLAADNLINPGGLVVLFGQFRPAAITRGITFYPPLVALGPKFPALIAFRQYPAIVKGDPGLSEFPRPLKPGY